MKAGLILLAASGLVQAQTQAPCLLTLGIYSSETGHRPGEYRDVVRIPEPSTEACREAGRYAQDDFDSRPDTRTLSQDLLDWGCSQEKPR